MNILIVQGHPDPEPTHYGHALAEAYAAGARDAGHSVRIVNVATLDFPLLRNKHEWEEGEVPPAIKDAQASIHWANHLVFIHPLWLGAMPALLKAFLEQAMRPGFAVGGSGEPAFTKHLKGRSAHVVVTMGMPAIAYRWFFRAHSLKSFERNILKFCGISPVRETLVGMVESDDAAKREQWLDKLRALGRAGR